MASSAVNFLNFAKVWNLGSCQQLSSSLLHVNPNFAQVRNYAARKGTREKRLKLHRAMKKKAEDKARAEAARPKPKPKLQAAASRRIKEEWKTLCPDNVMICKYHRWKIYDFAEAVQCHRETHHPTVYNKPNEMLQAFIELDMTAAKKNRYVDNFTRLVPIAHPFDHGEKRSLLVFCKTPELVEEALEAGASEAGGVDLIKRVESGHVSAHDYTFIIAHPNILPELVSIRGLLKRQFPTPRTGNLGVEIKDLVNKFKNGLRYTCQKDQYEEDYGWIELAIGPLSMDVKHLEDNMKAVLEDIDQMRPKRPGPFITRCMLTCQPSVERFKLNLPALLSSAAREESSEDVDAREEEDSDEEGQQANA